MAEATITIWDKEVGAVVWDHDRQVALFEIGSDFVKEEIDLAPITMPLETLKMGRRIFSFPNLNPQTFKKLPGLLADALPDTFGNALIDIWLSQKGRSSADFTPVERLCYIGKRAMGALEFHPSLVEQQNNIEAIQLEELVAIASKIMKKKEGLNTSFKENRTKALEQIIKVGTSAGGMRPKAVIAVHRENQNIVSGNLNLNEDYEHWLLKFDGIQDNELGDPQGYGKIEYIYYLMAKACGITMNPSKLLHEGNRSHFMTKRFDRKSGQKIHMQTLSGIAHFDFNTIGSTSYEQLFEVMRKLRLGKDELEQMFTRMVFNVVGRNQDDHTKNTAFLLEKDNPWRLSPAYDLTYSYNPAPDRNTSRHQMSINGKRDGITRNDLQKIAQDNNIKKPDKIIDAIIDVFQGWSKLAKDHDIHPKKIKQINNALRLQL